MSDQCPECGQTMTDPSEAAVLPMSELEALSAWWHLGNIRNAANFLSRSERTVINQLYSARIRNNVHTTGDLVPFYIGSMRTMAQLRTSHNKRRGTAA